jgi:S-adenosylmethionine-diacylglycerol 3-amino-3-carboxypropyl transferase
LVDANPAQLALTRLKRTLLTHTEPERRQALLGHSPMVAHERQAQLISFLETVDTPINQLGEPDILGNLGPDYCGRYEQLFCALQNEIAANPSLAAGLSELLSLGSAQLQRKWLSHRSGWWQELTLVFHSIFSLPILMTLFGEGATQNRRQAFAQHFLNQFRFILERQSVHANPFVWQMLRGQHPKNQIPHWLNLPSGPLSTTCHEVQATMLEAMQSAAASNTQYDMVHLSNVLDWLDPAQARATLHAAWQCTRPGGWVLIRQLNSMLNIRTLGESIGWQWDTHMSEKFAQTDRSFFYRALHVAQKP